MVMALSCGGSESFSGPATGPVAPEVVSNPSGNHKDIATISFLAPAEDAGRFYDLTPGSVSDPQRNAILARLARNPRESISQREDGDPSDLFQFTIHEQANQGGAIFYYVLDRLKGTTEPFIGYTPEILIGRSPHNGITAPLPVLKNGGNVITYRWTIPSSSELVDVALQPTILTQPDHAYLTFLPSGGNEVTLTFNLNFSEDSGRAVGEVTLNGQHLADIDTAANPQLAGILPLFRRPHSGLYHLSMTHNGEVKVDSSYVQRRLAWENPWPIIENGDVNTPITFTNRLVWKVGDDTLAADGDLPRWRAQFPGDSFPRSTGNQPQPYQEGANVSITWDPSALELSGRGLVDGRSFRLAPDEGGEYESAEQYREDIQARDPVTSFHYSVEADAATFQTFNPILRQSVNASGLVPAKARQVYIDNPRFQPNPPQPGQLLTFRADILSFFFDDPQIRWRLEIVSEDDGQTVRTFEQAEWADFPTGLDFHVDWDQADGAGHPVPPGNYRGNLRVEVRERTKVDRNGNNILVLAENFAQVYTGEKSLTVELFPNPESFESGEVGQVLLLASAEVKGLATPPQIHWRTTVQNREGVTLFDLESTSTSENFNTVWQAQAENGDALPDGVYLVKTVAEIPDGNLRAEKTIPFQIGTGQTVLIENLRVNPDPVDFDVQEDGKEGANVTADLVPFGYPETFVAGWTLKITSSDGSSLRTLTGQIQVNVNPEAETQEPTPFNIFWDGRKEDGSFFDLGEYSASLTIHPCGGEQFVSLNGSDGSEDSDEGCPPVIESVAFEVGGLQRLLGFNGVRFGLDRRLSPTALGPFNSYEYDLRSASLGAVNPQYQEHSPLISQAMPIIFAGSHLRLYVAPQFTVPFPPNPEIVKFVRIRAAGVLDGQEFSFRNPDNLDSDSILVEVADLKSLDKVALVAPAELPEPVGKHSLRINWKMDAIRPNGSRFAKELAFSTPRNWNGPHSIYLVLGNPYLGQSGSSYSSRDPEQQYPWYLTDAMNQSSGVEVTLRSPLDQAVTWGSGANSEDEILVKLVQSINAKSGWMYTGQLAATTYYPVPIVADLSEFSFRTLLRNNDIQCSDCAGIIGIYARFLGIEMDLEDIRPSEDNSLFAPYTKVARGQDYPRLFTRYLAPIGGTIAKATHYVPYSVAQEASKTRSVVWPVQLSGSNSPTDRQQFDFVFHQVAIQNARVYDPSVRYDASQSTKESINPDYYFNQLCAPELSRLVLNHNKYYGPIDPGAQSRFLPEYPIGSTNFVTFDGEVQSDYREKVLYLSTNPSLAARMGLNPKREASTTIRVILLRD